jgi:NitT/TauT family transport system substrate-binding protein
MRYSSICAAALLALAAMPGAAATIKVGLVKTTAGGAIYIAQERGYFAAAGCPADLVYFDSAQPVAVATVAGDIDFGVTGLTAGFFSLAGQGALRIIAGENQEVPGFQYLGHVVSNHAWDGGLKGFKDLPGHVFGVTQVGTTLIYSLALVADKYGFDFKSLRVVPLQSNGNVSSALAGGQIDAAVLPVSPVAKLIAHNSAHLLGWVGDETPGVQVSAVMAQTRTADDRRDEVACFLKAYREGTRDFHDAFTGPGETRRDGPGAADDLAIFAKYTGSPVAEVKLAIPYVEPQTRLNVQDVRRQIAWYKEQGMLKADVDTSRLIDMRYVVAMP